jgi:hypothetical protein
MAALLFDVQQIYKPCIYQQFEVEPYTESEFQARYTVVNKLELGTLHFITIHHTKKDI